LVSLVSLISGTTSRSPVLIVTAELLAELPAD
jgi:hypothetical protein